MSETHYDVIIVGAGAAGIMAAKALQRAGKTFCVLEARDRIGGRIKADTIANTVVDAGAGWTNMEQSLLLQLAKDHNRSIHRQFAHGNSILDLNHTISLFNREQFGLSFLANRALANALHKLEHDALSVPIDAPWKAENAYIWDSQTLQNWINVNITNPQAKAYFETSVTIELSIEPSKISYLYFLQLVHADQVLEKEPAGVEGAWSYQIEGGLFQLLNQVSHTLTHSIHLNSPVKAVQQTESHIHVHTEHGAFKADYCIIAIPPTHASHIDFTPHFSARRSTLFQSMPMGAAIKSFIAYPSPFWRDQDNSGIIISNTNPFSISLDVSDRTNHGMLTAFACGSEAIDLSAMEQEARCKLLIDHLVKHFGEQAKNPIDYIDTDWATEPWSHCGYSGYLPPGMLSILKGEISFPSGRIHWAGTETATNWHGSVEGALSSGVRASKEVLERLAG